MLNNEQHVTEGLGRTGKLRRVCLRLSKTAHGRHPPTEASTGAATGYED